MAPRPRCSRTIPNGQHIPRSAIGQFNPGASARTNGIQRAIRGRFRVSPWDFVLLIEGAALFGGSVARRLGTHTAARAVFPFTVESVAVGYGSATASEETTDGSRAEVWFPLWQGSGQTLSEVRQLFAEGARLRSEDDERGPLSKIRPGSVLAWSSRGIESPLPGMGS